MCIYLSITYEAIFAHLKHDIYHVFDSFIQIGLL